jgi:carbonic anhydrase/acetyltransferase-like protein (isoleucine patch superfamily)
MILPHLISNSATSDVLFLGNIHVKKGAIVGTRSVLLPGVVIGEYATINAMSVVAMNTQVGAYEVWGGNPAVKIGTVQPRASKPEQVA